VIDVIDWQHNIHSYGHQHPELACIKAKTGYELLTNFMG
jgi:hypothetical protein